MAQAPSHPMLGLLALAAIGIAFPACVDEGSGASSDPDVSSQVVLLVHGMGRGEASMKPLAESLAAAGYDARTFGYDSFGSDSETSARALRERLARLGADPEIERVHVVGHSLGNILTRMALLEHRPRRLGRVVMLAPPNHGSAWGRLLGPALGELVKPLDDLSDAEGSAVRSLPAPSGYEFGVIAARFDGKVSVESTHLEGERDHLVVNGVHTFLMRQEEVQRQVLNFLRDGRFARGDG